MIDFLRHNFRWVFGGFLLTYFSSIGQTFFIAASVAEWKQSFNLSHGEFGQLYMIATLGSALTLPFLGRLVDVFPERTVLLFVIPALGGAALLAAHAPSVFILLIAIYFLRLLGQGMMTHIALTATGRWFEQQRGRAVSLVVLGHQGGEFTLPIAFSTITIAYGYQAGWLTAVMALLLIGLPLAFWAFSKPRIASQGSAENLNIKDERSWTRGQVLRDPNFYLLLSGVLAPAFIGTVIFYHQDYITTFQGWPKQSFALSMSLMAATTTIVALINGVIIDRFGYRTILPFFLLPLASCCFVASITGGTYILFSMMFLLGVSYGISSTLFGVLWPEIYGVTNLGAVRSITVSAMVLATAVGPGLTGMLIDNGVDLPAQMRILGFYCLAATLAMICVYFRLKPKTA